VLMRAEKENISSPKGWLLYDGSCGFCSRWIPIWTPSLHKRGFAAAPLQAPWVRERLQLSENALLEDIRLLFADDSQLRGAEVYRYFMKRIWWAYPLYLLSILPGGRQTFNWAYRAFARNRFRFSKACGLEKHAVLVKQEP
jgi:predicted DCC family thiol-disulfide oxidoreductase YuxK